MFIHFAPSALLLTRAKDLTTSFLIDSLDCGIDPSETQSLLDGFFPTHARLGAPNSIENQMDSGGVRSVVGDQPFPPLRSSREIEFGSAGGHHRRNKIVCSGGGRKRQRLAPRDEKGERHCPSEEEVHRF